MKKTEDQIDWVSSEKSGKNHGGKRAGSGRKTKYESTKTIRIPTLYESAIKELILHLDETKMIDNNYPAIESESVFMRSLNGKPQFISFKTSFKKP